MANVTFLESLLEQGTEKRGKNKVGGGGGMEKGQVKRAVQGGGAVRVLILESAPHGPRSWAGPPMPAWLLCHCFLTLTPSSVQVAPANAASQELVQTEKANQEGLPQCWPRGPFYSCLSERTGHCHSRDSGRWVCEGHSLGVSSLYQH